MGEESLKRMKSRSVKVYVMSYKGNIGRNNVIIPAVTRVKLLCPGDNLAGIQTVRCGILANADTFDRSGLLELFSSVYYRSHNFNKY